jgi:hypothetical protein
VRVPVRAPVVSYRVARRNRISLGILFTPGARAWSPSAFWFPIDCGDLSRDATLLYFVLCAVADKHGMSFYADGTLAVMLHVPLRALAQARDELLARDLIAHEVRFTQVLSWPPPLKQRRLGPGGGLMQLGEILRQAAGLPLPDRERSSP